MNKSNLKPSLPTEISKPQLDRHEHANSRVLIADDESTIRKGLVFLLRKEGYEPLEAKNRYLPIRHAK